MNTLLYIVGLIIGFIIFIYILSTYESGKEKIKKIREDKNPAPQKTLSPEGITLRNKMKRAPGERMCPLCGSLLTRYEALYASQIETREGPKIMIYGCRHCYKPDEDPDEVKKSAY